MSWPDEDLKEEVEHFRSNVIQNDRPNNICFALSYPLSIFLKLNYDVILAGGKCTGTDGISLDHFWIKDGQNSEQIIDPTASQFPGLPEINYKLDPEFYLESEINWLDLYDNWAYSLKNGGLKRPHRLDPQSCEYTPDFDRLLLANIRAAFFLHSILRTNKVPYVSWKDHPYFDCIRICLYRLKNGNTKSDLLALPETKYLITEFGIKL